MLPRHCGNVLARREKHTCEVRLLPRGVGGLLPQGDGPGERAARRHGAERRALGAEGAGRATLSGRGVGFSI